MNRQPHTILIVDDTPEDCATYQSFLRQDQEWRYEFLLAENGALGASLCHEAQPSCVLLDYQLPDQSGLEVLAALADEHGEVSCPVVMLTGTDEVEIAVEAMKLGAQDFINKNRLTPLELQRAVHNAIERVRLRQAVQERERRFGTLTETIPQLVWTCAADGPCDYLSSRWMEYTGTTLAANLGYGWLDAVYPDDVPHTQEVWRQAVAAATNYEVEFRLRRADGAYRWHLSRALAMKNGAGKVVKWVGSCTDIEERKRIEVEREQLLKREQHARTLAENANRLKDEFLATLSHELRTPLNHSYGWVKMLRGGKLAPTQESRALEIIERNLQAQNRLIEDLLDVSRIITGRVQMEVQPVALTEVIERAVEAVRPAAEAKGLQLQVRLDPRAPAINGDADRLQQIVWNLVSNAIKFTPQGGHVQVCLERSHENVAFIVSDTGEGVAPEFLPYVFDRFSQQDSAKTRRHGGLGLGLAMVRHLVELHGGQVRVSSPGIGQGATFTVILPVRNAECGLRNGGMTKPTMPEEAPALYHPHAEILQGVKVLTVDDEPDALALLAALLQPAGAEVRTAKGMTEALSVLHDWTPDVLVSDIGMPNGDGYELIRRVHEAGQTAKLPAIALTAYASAEDRMRTLLAGYQMHVAKPVEPEELITVIASLTGRLGLGLNGA